MVKYISAFADAAEVARLKVTGARAEWSKDSEEHAVVAEGAPEVAAARPGALHLVMPPRGPFPVVEYSAADGLPSDWSSFGAFAMHIENASGYMINLHLAVTDAAGATFFTDNLWILRKQNRLVLPFTELRTTAGKSLDLSRVASFRLIVRSSENSEHELWLYGFQLEPAKTPIVAPSKKRLLLDFGPLGAESAAGARLVTEKTAYAAWRRYGWTSSLSPLASAAFKKGDILTSNWMWADLANSTATLRVDLPNGLYRARFYGGNYTVKGMPARSFALSVNGNPAVSEAVDAANYYTPRGHFLGINNWYEPGEDTYDKHIAPFFQTHDFAFEVSAGHAEFTWTGTLAAHGLLVTPVDEFKAAAEAVETARREEFATHIEAPKPPKKAPVASPADKKRGFLLWSRGWASPVGVFDAPKAAERSVKKLTVAAARGERGHATVTITPLETIGKVSVAVTSLKGPRGAALPARCVEVRALKYMWSGWPATLSDACLFPANAVPSSGAANVTFWLTVTPPAKAAGGVYRGKVRVSTGRGGKAEVPLEVEVRPFTLTDDHPVSYGLWRCTDYSMNYCLRYFWPEKIDYFRKILDAEAANMKAHGCTSFYFAPPFVKGVDGTHVVLDFSLCDEEVRVAKKYGFAGKKRPGFVFLLPDVARYLLKETRYGDYFEPEDLSDPLPQSELQDEFSELFNARYIDAARQINAYFEKQGLTVLLYATDEPRERNVQRWNRNLADSIRYCRLLGDNVPGAKIFVDPMRDSEDGVDYLPFLNHLDVVATHAWDQSAKIIEKCRRDGRPALWYFNAIAWDRYDFGFEIAASPATGCWQWHYQWDLVPFQPFHPGFKWGLTIPGPNGPLDKPGFELFAEGVTDYRYVATLRERIASAKSAHTAAKEVAAAEKTLAKLLANTAPYAYKEDYDEKAPRPRTKIAGKTLDEWRAILARQIAAIDGACEASAGAPGNSGASSRRANRKEKLR